VTYYFYNTTTPVFGTTTPVFTDTQPVGTDSKSTGALGQGGFSFIAVYSGDSNFSGSRGPIEPLGVVVLAQVAPTNTTAAQFASGTSSTLPAIFYSNSGGKIGQSVNPGVFFYFSFAVAPSLTGSQTATINVNEITPTGYNFPFLISGLSQVALYNSTGTTIVGSGSDLGNGNISFKVTAGMESTNGGNTFVISIKYSSKSIAGDPTPASLGLPTTQNYSWQTSVNGGPVQASAGVPIKLSGTQLAPTAGNGATSLTERQLQPVVQAAIVGWEAAGASAEQLDVLRNTPIHIVDFLDAPRLGVESDGEIWLNATAAGWGWSTDLAAAPAAGRMDLLSVIEHEFGHVLFGVQDGTGLMAATLEPGVRLLPTTAALGLDQQPVGSSANPIAAAPSMALHVAAVSPSSFITPTVAMSANGANVLTAEVVSRAVTDSVRIPANISEPRVVVPPTFSPMPAYYAVMAQDAGRLSALDDVLRPTSGQSEGTDGLDLLFSEDDAYVPDDLPEFAFASSEAAPFDIVHDLSAATETVRTHQSRDWLFAGSGAALTDTGNDVGTGAVHPAAVLAMAAGLAGSWGARRGDRPSELETRARRPFRA
jgi:hypothetical protein